MIYLIRFILAWVFAFSVLILSFFIRLLFGHLSTFDTNGKKLTDEWLGKEFGKAMMLKK